MKKTIAFIVAISLVIIGIAQDKIPNDTLRFEGEKHFKNIQQLTFGGDNAEAYWSFDSKHIVFQRTNPKEGINCDQIFIGKIPEKL